MTKSTDNNAGLEIIADKLLVRIRSKPNHNYDIKRISNSLKCTPEIIAQAAKTLAGWGYRIKINNHGKISFIEAPDLYLADEVTYQLETKYMGREVLAYRSVQSTNILAQVMAVSGAREGTLIISEHQKKGIGRLGRKWYSPEGVGLYCSLILRPKIHPSQAPGISLIAAVAVAETIAEYGNLNVKIKWPNDVLISGKKVSGILTELSGEFNQTHFVVVGVGVNINNVRKDFATDIIKGAGSIRLALGKKIRRVDFLKKFLKHFEREYDLFKRYRLNKVRPKILKYSSLIGHKVDLSVGRKPISGNVLDIDSEGRLVIKTRTGIMTFSAGEVTSH